MNQRLAQQLKNRKDMLEQSAIPPGAILIGNGPGQREPTPEEINEMKQAQWNNHFVMSAQGMFNQVVAQMLATSDPNINPLTHEKMLWLAEQCKGASPYILQAFGAVKINDRILPTENMETQIPQDAADEPRSVVLEG